MVPVGVIYSPDGRSIVWPLNLFAYYGFYYIGPEAQRAKFVHLGEGVLSLTCALS